MVELPAIEDIELPERVGELCASWVIEASGVGKGEPMKVGITADGLVYTEPDDAATWLYCWRQALNVVVSEDRDELLRTEPPLQARQS